LLSKVSDEAQSLDLTIKTLEDDMRSMDGDSEAYATCLNRLERLYKLKEKHSKRAVNPDTWVIAGANLLGILVIVAYEHGHVIGSRALNFAGKLR